MNQLPYLLPWVRVALLIRSIRATTFDEATWPTAKTVTGAGVRDAEPARAGGLVELDPAGRRLRVALAAVLIRS